MEQLADKKRMSGIGEPINKDKEVACLYSTKITKIYVIIILN